MSSRGKGRKRHGGRRANRGTPPNPHRHTVQPWIRRLVGRALKRVRARPENRRFPILWANVNAAIAAEISFMRSGITPEAEHRIRCDMRYDREIAAARTRGWTETAARIEAERAAWLATDDD